MRIVTWNVNSLNVRLPRVLELLAEHAPDVLCLQETKCDPRTFPTAALEEAGYVAHHHSAGRWAGVAILAKAEHEITATASGLPGELVPDEARWCEATVAGLRIASAYVTNGRELDSMWFDEKLGFLDAMRERAPELDVIVGDFNVAPADSDVYDPAAFAGSTHVTADERDRIDAILAAGFVDAYRHLHPDTQQFTWWDYRQGHFHRGLGMRIDLALLRTPDPASRVAACGIDRAYRKGTKPSDHAPLLVDLT